MFVTTIITDLHEKSINLNEIPGLLIIQKIKSTKSNDMQKATTRVTQEWLHGRSRCAKTCIIC